MKFYKLTIKQNLIYWARFTFDALIYLFITRKNVRNVLHSSTAATDSVLEKRVVFFPMLETSHYQFWQMYGVAKALSIRGHKIVSLLCGGQLEACEIKSSRTCNVLDVCASCRFNAKIVAKIDDFDTYYIDQIIDPVNSEHANQCLDKFIAGNYDFIDNDIDITVLKRDINDSVIRYYYGGGPNEKEHSFIYKLHAKTAILTYLATKFLDQKYNFDFALSNMRAYSFSGTVANYFESTGRVYNLILLTALDYRMVVLNPNEIFSSNKRFHLWDSSRGGRALSLSENKELDNFLNHRYSGSADMFSENSFFSDVDTPRFFTNGKRNVVLFSNVYWDVGVSERGALYSSVLDWIFDTFEFASMHPDINFILKTHPIEKLSKSPSAVGVKDIILKKYGSIPENFFFIEPEMKVNTYKLFKHIDLGVIFNGTVGLEMLLNNVLVVSVGRTPYWDLMLNSNPKSKEEYFGFLSGSHIPHMGKSELIRKFAYFYFIATLYKWPFTNGAWGAQFYGYRVKTANDWKEGRNVEVDHLLNCLLSPEKHTPEVRYAK